jgi:hypothetical protein
MNSSYVFDIKINDLESGLSSEYYENMEKTELCDLIKDLNEKNKNLENTNILLKKDINKLKTKSIIKNKKLEDINVKLIDKDVEIKDLQLKSKINCKLLIDNCKLLIDIQNLTDVNNNLESEIKDLKNEKNILKEEIIQFRKISKENNDVIRTNKLFNDLNNKIIEQEDIIKQLYQKIENDNKKSLLDILGEKINLY